MTISIELFKLQVDDQIDALDVEMPDVRRYETVQSAVDWHSRDVPDEYTEDVTGNGGRYYALASVLTYWSEGFSDLVQIEYPAADVSANETPVYLDRDDWDDNYWAEIGGTHTRHLRMIAHAPAATEAMRVVYTVPYLWAGGGTEVSVAQVSHGFSVGDYIYLDSTWTLAQDNTARRATAAVTSVADSGNFGYKVLYVDVPQRDFFSICNLASSFACRAMAAKYAKASDTTMGADSTTHTSRTSEFASRAEEFFKLYQNAQGLDQEQKHQAAGEFISWDTYPDEDGSDRRWLTHGRRDRNRLGGLANRER